MLTYTFLADLLFCADLLISNVILFAFSCSFLHSNSLPCLSLHSSDLQRATDLFRLCCTYTADPLLSEGGTDIPDGTCCSLQPWRKFRDRGLGFVTKNWRSFKWWMAKLLGLEEFVIFATRWNPSRLSVAVSRCRLEYRSQWGRCAYSWMWYFLCLLCFLEDFINYSWKSHVRYYIYVSYRCHHAGLPDPSVLDPMYWTQRVTVIPRWYRRVGHFGSWSYCACHCTCIYCENIYAIYPLRSLLLPHIGRVQL